ncbi:MAG TPA: peptide ABC transporter substrate-binding protein [Lachnospiraceae bacterium]|nr:peptide ABC transporter substrate-binding protein [Lachnospiraceae bacterium]HAP73246.1 peptide ABC transporter substrate-binding protein [Lachnospiraceae bacterium]HBH70531.1 peptide ABC transporter substrate-binding protein [Lachnospiraceae bacterium]
MKRHEEQSSGNNTERDPIVRAQDVRVTFRAPGSRDTVKAVDGVSLEVRRGEVFGVVGESGCGKSTLGRALLGLVPLSGGKVIADGRDLSTLSAPQMKEMRRKIQIIFQDPSACLNPRRTVREILTEPYLIHGIRDRKKIDEEIGKLIDAVGLAPYHLSRYPHELSGGQKQRIGIARALTLHPEFIVCDECVSALDVSVQAQVLNLLMRLRGEMGLTYFFISHNLNVIYQVSDRVAVMYLGRIVEIAPYRSLFENHFHPYTEALLSAIPGTGEGTKNRIILQGEVPSPQNPPTGCHFHTRCPKACPICSKEVPRMREILPGHFAACHLYDEKI